MDDFSQIASLLKDMRQSPAEQIQAKIRTIQQSSAQLADLCDVQTITQTQRAVEDRMGPQMCDNSQQPEKQLKNDLIKIFKEYEDEIQQSQKRLNQLFCSTKRKIEQSILMLVARQQQLQQKYEELKQQLKIEMQRGQQQMQSKLDILQKDQNVDHLQQVLVNYQNKFQLLYMDVCLSQNKKFNEMLSLILQLRLH